MQVWEEGGAKVSSLSPSFLDVVFPCSGVAVHGAQGMQLIVDFSVPQAMAGSVARIAQRWVQAIPGIRLHIETQGTGRGLLAPRTYQPQVSPWLSVSAGNARLAVTRVQVHRLCKVPKRSESRGEMRRRAGA